MLCRKKTMGNEARFVNDNSNLSSCLIQGWKYNKHDFKSWDRKIGYWHEMGKCGSDLKIVKKCKRDWGILIYIAGTTK